MNQKISTRIDLEVLSSVRGQQRGETAGGGRERGEIDKRRWTKKKEEREDGREPEKEERIGESERQTERQKERHGERLRQ